MYVGNVYVGDCVGDSIGDCVGNCVGEVCRERLQDNSIKFHCVMYIVQCTYAAQYTQVSDINR